MEKALGVSLAWALGVLWMGLSYNCSQLEKDQSLTPCRLVRVSGRMLLGMMGGLELPVASQMLLCLVITKYLNSPVFGLICCAFQCCG